MMKKTLLDFIHEKNCDNYMIYQEKEDMPIITFYQCSYMNNISKEVLNHSTEIIKSYQVEKDKIFKNQKNLIVYIKQKEEE